MSAFTRSSRRDLFATMSLSLLSGAVVAQDTGREVMLEEVIVTAQKRAESLSDVPLAVTALSAERLQDAGIVNLEGVKNLAPGFFMVPTPQGNAISIRGVFSGTNGGFEQSVGTYVDGLYHGRGQQARVPFLDLERVEVLRGPQSILFGKNSVAGALNITTARPTSSLDGYVSALYEPTYDEQLYTAMLAGPLGTDRLRGRVAARYREYGGNIENLTKHVDESVMEEKGVRGWLEFDLTDAVQLSFKAEHNEFNSIGRAYEVVDDIPATRPGAVTYAQTLFNLGAALGQPVDPSVLNNFPDGKRSANAPEFSDNTLDEFAFYVDWALGEHTLTAITGYTEYEFSESTDADITAAPLLVQLLDEDFEQWSQEIRLASPTGGRFEYLGGVYWEKTEVNQLTRLPFTPDSLVTPIAAQSAASGVLAAGGTPAQAAAAAAAVRAALPNTDGPRAFSQKSESYAAFLQGSWNISDAFRANAGLRYTTEDKEASRTISWTDLNGNPLPAAQMAVVANINRSLLNKTAHAVEGGRSEDHWLPSLGLQYDIGDDAMVYATWTKGAKGGGYDAISNNAPENGGSFEFEPERAESYEVGAKTTLGGVLELNLAAYFTDFKDLQVSTFDGVGYNVTNAGASEIQGVELDSRWQATSNLLFSLSVAYTDFEFKEFIGPCPVVIGTAAMPRTARCDNAGKPNQYVADWTGSASVDYRIPIGSFELRTVLDLYYSSDYYASPNLDEKQRQEAYTKLNGRLAFGPDDGQWDIALVGKNLTDELIMPYGADLPLSNSLTAGGFSAMRYVEPGRSVAVQATLRF